MSSDACYCDYESPKWYRSETRKARKQHRCSECANKIQPGERYEYAVGMHDDIYTARTCLACVDLREFIRAHVPCFCWAHFSLHDDCLSTADYYRDEAPGLMFGTYRRLKRIERRAA